MRRNYDTARVTAREAATFDQDRLWLGLKDGGVTRARFSDEGDRIKVEVLGEHDRVGTYYITPGYEVVVRLVRKP